MGSVPGVELIQPLEADAVYCSHEHGDHHAIHLVTLKDEVPDPNVLTHSFLVPHDDAEGTLRGMNLIQVFSMDGVRLAHLGDLGRMLNEEEIAQLKNVDVLCIPCGGYYTIDKEIARQVIDAIQPKVTILMHYRTDTFGFDVLEHLDTIETTFPELQKLEQTSIETPFPEGIFTLQPLQ